MGLGKPCVRCLVTGAEYERIRALVESPPPPNARLVRAFKRYQELEHGPHPKWQIRRDAIRGFAQYLANIRTRDHEITWGFLLESTKWYDKNIGLPQSDF